MSEREDIRELTRELRRNTEMTALAELVRREPTCGGVRSECASPATWDMLNQSAGVPPQCDACKARHEAKARAFVETPEFKLEPFEPWALSGWVERHGAKLVRRFTALLKREETP